MSNFPNPGERGRFSSRRKTATVLRAIPGHVDATRIRSSAAAAIRTSAPTRLAGE